MPLNVYFTNGTRNEQNLLEDLIIESLSIKGLEFMYIPRTLVSKDEILGEDRLSKFENSFPIEMYFKNVDTFDGAGSFIQKFGLMIDQSATLTVARRRWEQLIGRFGKTIIPERPCEGDLLYFPLTKALFEIKFVQHQNPFYQLNRLYVFDLEIQLFRYGSEEISTGDSDIDDFEGLMSADVGVNVDVDEPRSYGDNNKFKTEAFQFVLDENNPFGDTVTQEAPPSDGADSYSETADNTFISGDKD